MDIKAYHSKKKDLQVKLNSFKSISDEQQFHEFLFCLLTPQSNAQKCWSAVEELIKLDKPTLGKVTTILKSRTRFHNTKAKRIMNAYKIWPEIKTIIKTHQGDTKDLRNLISEKVNGYGLKEAGHFLRNIGKSNNKIAILDRHIIRHMESNNIKVDKIKNYNHYLALEEQYLNFAQQLKIPADELDMFWWSQENGEIFK